MNPYYPNMPLDDLLVELQLETRGSGVPPIDLVVALMGYGIDAERLMNQMYIEEDEQ